MSNLAAAFEGASQGLGQMASMAMQHEMAQAMAMRAENLAILRNRLSTRRELLVTGARGQVLNAVSNNRVAAEHTARDEEIDRQEGGRARNQATAQHQQLIDTEAAQSNAFTNQSELQARAQSRTDQVAARREWLAQRDNASREMTQLRGQLMQRWQQLGSSNTSVTQGATDAAALHDAAQRLAVDSGDDDARTTLQNYAKGTDAVGALARRLVANPADAQALTQLRQLSNPLNALRQDPFGASIITQYAKAHSRFTEANGSLAGLPKAPQFSGYAPATDSPSAPTTMPPGRAPLINIPQEGPGIADTPYPAPSGADSVYMNAPMGDSGASSDDDNGPSGDH